MASYVITGASRGLGFEFVRQLSSDPKNIVIALVRNKPATEQAVAAEIARDNVFVVEGDITNYDSLKKAASETKKITGGSLDYLVANAAIVSEWSAFDGMGTLGKDPVRLEEDLMTSFNVNVVGNVHLFNLFLPLIQKGSVKKVIAISTGVADVELIRKYEIDIGGPYSISKAALNLAVAKFSAQYQKDGILFMAISPGLVETGHHADATEEQLQATAGMGAKFASYAPHFKGPITPAESVSAILGVIAGASIESGSAGSFVSHFGNKQWL